mmetsp:Transcript_6304/g.20160  ORF Transcript_6304/g.20160 Transcript_6304/m.20160 type:complete len:221 (-) Transcript_6304:262-924(-)
MQAKVCDCIAKNALLKQNNVSPCFRDLLAKIRDVGSLFFQNSVHLLIVTNNDGVFDICLWRRKLELKHCDLGVGHSRGATSGLRSLLGEHKSLHQFSVVDSASQLPDNPDVIQVRVGVDRGIGDVKNSVNSQRSKQPRVLRYNLGRQRRRRALDKSCTIIKVNRDSHTCHNLFRLAGGQLKCIGNLIRVNAPRQESAARIQQSTSKNNNSRCPVACFNVL